MASHHDEDTMPEETQGYKLSQPKQSLAEYQQMGMSTNTFQKPPARKGYTINGRRTNLSENKCVFNGGCPNPIARSKCFVTCNLGAPLGNPPDCYDPLQANPSVWSTTDPSTRLSSFWHLILLHWGWLSLGNLHHRHLVLPPSDDLRWHRLVGPGENGSPLAAERPPFPPFLL